MSEHFVTSDTHFGHHNIIKYCQRPFLVHPETYEDDKLPLSAARMDEEMVERWNATVRPADTVYFIGDFAFCKWSHAEHILSRLLGTIHLIRGNHDGHRIVRLRKWASVSHHKSIDVAGQALVLRHLPVGRPAVEGLDWNPGGVVNESIKLLHGHSHGDLPGSKRRCDVGVDCWDYRPVTIEQALERMAASPDPAPNEAYDDKIRHDRS